MTGKNQIRSYGPGKFDTILDSHIYELSLAGCDDETGESETSGWFGILRGLKCCPPFSDVSASWELNEAELAYLREHPAGCIVSEDSQGFVSVEYFKTEKALDKRWNSICRYVEKFENETCE